MSLARPLKSGGPPNTEKRSANPLLKTKVADVLPHAQRLAKGTGSLQKAKHCGPIVFPGRPAFLSLALEPGMQLRG